ncbi:MAG: hypothetical protein ACOC8D_02305 [bacterium]
MSLFPSKAEQRARRNVAIKTGKRTIRRYIAECQRMGRKYLDMARKAVALHDEAGSRQYLYQRHLYEQQAEKWGRFLLRMEDLILRGQMSGAMAGLVDSVQALSREIRANVSPRRMAKVVARIQGDMANLDLAEEQLTDMMSTLDLGMGAPLGDGQAAEIPEEIRGVIDRAQADLVDEVGIAESVPAPAPACPAAEPPAEPDDRLRRGMERLRALRERADNGD